LEANTVSLSILQNYLSTTVTTKRTVFWIISRTAVDCTVVAVTVKKETELASLIHTNLPSVTHLVRPGRITSESHSHSHRLPGSSKDPPASVLQEAPIIVFYSKNSLSVAKNLVPTFKARSSRFKARSNTTKWRPTPEIMS
jgi:hypothetical protein